jgi:hypothetical protein
VPKAVRLALLGHLRQMRFRFGPRCSVRLRKAINDRLRIDGWSGRVRLDGDSSISITSMNNGIALCLQTGNMSRFYADLLKLQLLKRRRKAKAAIYIIPMAATSKKMSSNIVNYERLTKELHMFRDIITLPVLVIGIR